MKEYISNKTVLVGIAIIALVSASIYFVNPEFSASSSHDNSTLSDTAAEDNIATATSSLKNVAHEEQVSDSQGAVYLDNNTGRKEQNDTISERDKDIAILEKRNQVQLTEFDLALPPPSGKNVTGELTGEYADQINPQDIVDKAKSEGYLPPEVAPDSHPPSGKNIASEPQGENAQEVSQQALIDRAKSEGYLPPEVAPDSHPPSGKNIASEPQGENEQEVSQQALIDRAKSEGYLPPEEIDKEIGKK